MKTLSDITPEQLDAVTAQMEEIFFETSGVKTFSSQDERERFRHKYFSTYLNRPDLCFVVLSNQTDKVEVIGYLLSTSETNELHYSLHPYLNTFRSRIDSGYPAHLHINLTEKARGKGTGKLLLKAMEQKLQECGVSGVHLITNAKARNVSFYLAGGYREIGRDGSNRDLIMLGKSL